MTKNHQLADATLPQHWNLWQLHIKLPDSARPVPGRKFWNIQMAFRNQWPMGKLLRCGSNNEAMTCWNGEVHQPMSKWWLRRQWTDMKESMHNRSNEPMTMNRWINEPMNQWIQWSNEAMDQWISESVNQWTNQRVNSESMSQWIHEWINASLLMIQCIIACLGCEWVSRWINQCFNESTNQYNKI